VEPTRLEPVIPTLPGPGGGRDQARYAQDGSVATVVGRAIVVTVVRTVVSGAVRGIAAHGCGRGVGDGSIGYANINPVRLSVIGGAAVLEGCSGFPATVPVPLDRRRPHSFRGRARVESLRMRVA